MTPYFCMFAAEELNPRHSIITNADKNTKNRNRVLSTTCPRPRSSGGNLFRSDFTVIPFGINVTILMRCNSPSEKMKRKTRKKKKRRDEQITNFRGQWLEGCLTMDLGWFRVFAGVGMEMLV